MSSDRSDSSCRGENHERALADGRDIPRHPCGTPIPGGRQGVAHYSHRDDNPEGSPAIPLVEGQLAGKTTVKSDYLGGRPIEPLKLRGNEQVADMIDNVFDRSGFNARRLAEGAELWKRMIEEDATIALTVAGAMTPIGMSGVFNSLIEAGFVDLIISTGANLYHDMHRPYDYPMVQGSFNVDDNELDAEGIARIYDVFIAEEDTLQATDYIVAGAVMNFEAEGPISTARLHHSMGKRIAQTAKAPEKSTLTTAARYDVPIYTSSPGDSSIGLTLLVPHMFGHSIHLSPLRDVIETVAIIRAAKLNGAVILGGGSPKNFYLQTFPGLSQFLLDHTKGGIDYFLQLTTDSPHWGGLSGATASEAASWGKVKDAQKNNVMVYSCASLTFPLLAQYVLTRCKPRTPRRLFTRMDELVQELYDAVKENKRFQQQFEGLFQAATKPGRPKDKVGL